MSVPNILNYLVHSCAEIRQLQMRSMELKSSGRLGADDRMISAECTRAYAIMLA